MHQTATASTLPRPAAASQCSLSVPSPKRYPDDVDELLLELGLFPEDDELLLELGLLPEDEPLLEEVELPLDELESLPDEPPLEPEPLPM
jgi:hypothetical protein